MFDALLFFQCQTRGQGPSVHHQFVIHQEPNASADGGPGWSFYQ
jgi:hypothetical protein